MSETRTPTTDKGWQAHLSNVRPPQAEARMLLGDGLIVRLKPNGEKIFEFRIRRAGERNPRRVRLGAFPVCSVADARKRVVELRALAKEGRDPALAERRARAGIATPRTLRELVAEYLRRREGSVAAKTHKLEADLLEGPLTAALGGRLLSDLEPVDLGVVVGDYAARLKREGRSNGTNANKLLAAARRMFKTARGWGLVVADPTAGLAKPAKEAPRDRILVDGRLLVGSNPKVNEIGQLVAALTGEPSPIPASRETRLALLLTLLLGLRAIETCALEWKAVDLDGDAPTIAITRSKTSAGLRTLPLAPPAAAILRELKQRARKRPAKGAAAPAARASGFIFPAEEGAKRAAHMHAESLSRAFARSCARLGIAEASTHDLRRTCLSGLIELGHESVADRIAGHVPRHVMARHYDRAHRLDAMRAALDAWAAAVDDARARYVACVREASHARV